MSDKKKYSTTLKFLDYDGCALHQLEIKGDLSSIIKILSELNHSIDLGALMEVEEKA